MAKREGWATIHVREETKALLDSIQTENAEWRKENRKYPEKVPYDKLLDAMVLVLDQKDFDWRKLVS